jgi:putative transcriptional regulator
MKELLVAARKSKHLTHEQVAEQVEISRQYYGMIESGERNPSVQIAKKIGVVLEIDWTLFFEYNSNHRLRSGDSDVSTF